jgi:hypothetical protein
MTKLIFVIEISTITTRIVIRGSKTFFEPMTPLFERLKTVRVSDHATIVNGSPIAVLTANDLMV